MKKKIILCGMAVIAGTILYQNSTFAQPNSVTPESSVLYQHGRNSGGVDPQENVDSVTVGGTTKYYVLPDAIVNPGFNYTTDLFANVISTFNWNVTPAIASGGVQNITGYATAPHYKQITWSATGSGTIQVTEVAHASQGGCTGSTTSINVQVIAAPDVTAVSVPNSTCYSGTIPYSLTCPNATLTISSAVNGNKGVVVNWSLTGPSGFTPILNQTANLGNSTTLNLSAVTLTHPGTYTLTINTVTDRIATKSGLTAIADGTSTTFVVTAAPNTGPIYHIPNK
ncbi:MAG: hypothetical protein N2662_07130 [Bacteroidales bacterium]|nr:hypothetical protein [Bacteroidales bacterium]